MPFARRAASAGSPIGGAEIEDFELGAEAYAFRVRAAAERTLLLCGEARLHRQNAPDDFGDVGGFGWALSFELVHRCQPILERVARAFSRSAVSWPSENDS